MVENLREASQAILQTLRGDNEPSPAEVRELLSASLQTDRAAAESATMAMFRDLVEPLNDSFIPEDVGRYNRFFCRLLNELRGFPAAAKIHRELDRAGIKNDSYLLEQIPKPGQHLPLTTTERSKVRKIIVLSRVTIGADIAVTSVILEKCRQSFPRADCLLAGQQRLEEIFSRDKNFRLLPLEYPARGNILERVSAWLEMRKIIDRETAGMAVGEYVIIDPKSRLTQLGILPLGVPARFYFLFEPDPPALSGEKSLGAIVNEWFDRCLLGEVQPVVYPVIAIAGRFQNQVERIWKIHDLEKKKVVVINFGVGGNERKRLGDDFEFQLVSRLVKKGLTVIIDQGFGPAEEYRTRQLRQQMAAQGFRIDPLSGDMPAGEREEADCLAWFHQGGIGSLAALISRSQAYIGYDSLGQHLAAALSVPEIVIFTGYPNRRFFHKWRPLGSSRIDVIDAAHISPAKVLETILRPETLAAANIR